MQVLFFLLFQLVDGIADHVGWTPFVFRLEGVIRTPNSKMYIGVEQRNFGSLCCEFVEGELDDVRQTQAMLNQRLKREYFFVFLPNCYDYSHRRLPCLPPCLLLWKWGQASRRQGRQISS